MKYTLINFNPTSVLLMIGAENEEDLKAAINQFEMITQQSVNCDALDTLQSIPLTNGTRLQLMVGT